MTITFDNIQKTFAQNRVLRDISFHVENANVIAVLGPSGGGKTTLLRVLAGLEKPEAGNITINNHPIPYAGANAIDNYAPLRSYRRRLGVVFQSFNLLPHLSAVNNIVLPLVKVHGWKKQDALDKAQTLLTQFSLGEHGHKHPHQLSGGQKQRVSICRAIAPSPEFLLFDEPTSALDPDFIIEVLDTIRSLKSLCDFIIVTHHTGFARSTADYVLFLSEGTVIEHGPPEQVYEKSDNPVVAQYFENVLGH